MVNIITTHQCYDAFPKHIVWCYRYHVINSEKYFNDYGLHNSDDLMIEIILKSSLYFPYKAYSDRIEGNTTL